MESRKPFYARGEPTHVGFPVSLRPAPRRGVHLHLWNFIAILVEFNRGIFESARFLGRLNDCPDCARIDATVGMLRRENSNGHCNFS
jgi:hypothetical protein